MADGFREPGAGRPARQQAVTQTIPTELETGINRQVLNYLNGKSAQTGLLKRKQAGHVRCSWERAGLLIPPRSDGLCPR